MKKRSQTYSFFRSSLLHPFDAPYYPGRLFFFLCRSLLLNYHK